MNKQYSKGINGILKIGLAAAIGLESILGAGCISDARRVEAYKEMQLKQENQSKLEAKSKISDNNSVINYNGTQLKLEEKVRLSDDNYIVAYKLSREEVEKQLIALAKSAEREDSWIYVEGSEGNILIDVGRKYTVGTEMPDGWVKNGAYTTTFSVKEVESLTKPGDVITSMHIHPSGWRTPGYCPALHPSKQDEYSQIPSKDDCIADFTTRTYLEKKGRHVKSSQVIGELMKCEFRAKIEIDEKAFAAAKDKCIWSGRDVRTEIESVKEELSKQGILLNFEPIVEYRAIRQ